MDDKQIAFIICVNDEEEFAECRHYLERLYVPDGYSMDIISIREAPSMTAGYNAGMKSSGAKYKVYLHQDVFIVDQDFIENVISVFLRDEQIGLLGVIGERDLGRGVAELTGWDTGSVSDNHKCWCPGYPLQENVFLEVQAIDGLLMVTQYDIPWREDIFSGWHFYDLSQCMEFQRAGYKVVVPWQEKAWCYHDNRYPDLMTYYDGYASFLCEYAEIESVSANIDTDRAGYEMEKEYAQIVKTMQDGIEELIIAGAKAELRVLFKDPTIQGDLCLKEHETIVFIDALEEREQSKMRFWDIGMTASQLLIRLRRLKHALKRIEYEADDQEKYMLQDRYSEYAVRIVCDRYAIDKSKICKKIDMDI